MPTQPVDPRDGSLASWDVTTLTKFVQDILTRNPPGFLPNVIVDQLTVSDQLTVNDKVSFNGQTFKIIGNTAQPAFQNSWVNWGNPNPAASYVKGPDGWVHIHGLVKNLTNPLTLPSIIFTLPPGYRPESTCVFGVAGGSASGVAAFSRVDIDNAGNVSCITPSATVQPWISLEKITFKAV